MKTASFFVRGDLFLSLVLLMFARDSRELLVNFSVAFLALLTFCSRFLEIVSKFFGGYLGFTNIRPEFP